MLATGKLMETGVQCVFSLGLNTRMNGIVLPAIVLLEPSLCEIFITLYFLVKMFIHS
jgi:hypothetical protein